MAVQNVNGHTGSDPHSVPYIDLPFEVEDSDASVLRLVCWIRPKWRDCRKELKITKFTDGITNTLLMVARHRPGAPQTEAEENAILMRAYGNGTDLIIDRDREAKSHGLLAMRQMAPPLLARFQNGLLYGFIPGTPCKAEDLTKERVWRGVARKLAEWHARVPVSGISTSTAFHNSTNGYTNGHCSGEATDGENIAAGSLSSRRPVPNVWSVMQKWVNALSIHTEKERARKTMLQKELDQSFAELDSEEGIVQLPSPDAPSTQPVQPVTFIDYEYATPAPAAFDISNHFAEWVGYDCDYNMVPTRSIRRQFIQEYITSYSVNADQKLTESAVDDLYELVDRWRGIPGLYWGIWAMIQAKISQIDFDYSRYAEDRLGEYFAWRAETDGTRSQQGKVMPLRERRWAEE